MIRLINRLDIWQVYRITLVSSWLVHDLGRIHLGLDDLSQVHLNLTHNIKVLLSIRQSTLMSSRPKHNLVWVHLNLVQYTCSPNSICFGLESAIVCCERKFYLFSLFVWDNLDFYLWCGGSRCSRLSRPLIPKLKTICRRGLNKVLGSDVYIL